MTTPTLCTRSQRQCQHVVHVVNNNADAQILKFILIKYFVTFIIFFCENPREASFYIKEQTQKKKLRIENLDLDF